MSLLDDEEVLLRKEVIRPSIQEERLLSIGIFRKGAVKCFISNDYNNIYSKIAKLHNLTNNPTTTFDNAICSILNKAIWEELKQHASRNIASIDCRALRKGDAYGWLSALAKAEDDLIVIINYVTQIPDGDRNIFDDPGYVANLLLNSWKNEDIYAGDVHINRKNMTILLTCPPEDADKLRHACRMNSYAWIGDLDEWCSKVKDVAEQTYQMVDL